ncbi:MAG: PHA/PHB synthase family protein [Paracoccaceae bacterium]
MTISDRGDDGIPSRLEANLARIDALTQRLMQALARRKPTDPGVGGPSNELFMKAASAYVAAMMQDPAKLMEQQVAYWGRTLRQAAAHQAALTGGSFKAPEPDPAVRDRRFSNPLWDTHPGFSFLKSQYLINAEAVKDAVRDMDLDPREKARVDYFARQIVDLFAPTNFLGTNPDALEKAVATEGESLVQGLENLVADLEASNGELLVTLADRKAFVLGQNIAATPGKVVFRNRMLELIQYTPTTETVHQTPLLIFPPWINKFYVLDLKPANSLIKWVVDQGYTLFVVSWVNPDASFAEVGMDDYVEQGYLAAIDEVRRITGQEQINAVGYCIAGTTLALTLSYLKSLGRDPVRSATFFTTLTDFSDPGEVGVFLAEDFLEGIGRQIDADGILSRVFMAKTFSFLRSNDLIYAPAIKSYMLGETPPAFDLLYWNGDGTNLPGKMAKEYLYGLCRDDGLARGTFAIKGRKVSLNDVTLPLCAIACETDHIAHWRGSFNGVRQMGSGDKTFILSQSGHIAGIVNPPTKDKYGHYTHPGPMTTPEAWREAAEFHAGSWWPRWEAWLATRSGPQVPARQPVPAHILCDAPGTFVSAVPAV